MIDLYQAWRSGKVNRMHTMPQLHRENIAEHTWGLLFLILRVWPDAPREFIIAAIFHDAGEIATGDIPGHIKWSNPDLQAVCERLETEHVASMGVPLFAFALSPKESLLLEIFDRLEFVISAMHDLRLGNLNSEEYMKRSLFKAERLLEDLRLLEPGSFLTGIGKKAIEAVYLIVRQYGSR